MAYLHHLGRIVRPLCIWLDGFEIAILLRRNICVRNAIDLCAAAAPAAEAAVVTNSAKKMHQYRKKKREQKKCETQRKHIIN